MTTAPIPEIALVDDEPAVLTTLHRLLRDLGAGYDLIAVADGGAVLAQFFLATLLLTALVLVFGPSPLLGGLLVVAGIGLAAVAWATP